MDDFERQFCAQTLYIIKTFCLSQMNSKILNNLSLDSTQHLKTSHKRTNILVIIIINTFI